jgi:hypothetical protein
MANYQVGDTDYYAKGVLRSPGEDFSLPDEEKPSKSFLPLDGPARAAYAKAFGDEALRARLAIAGLPVGQPAPEPLSEAKTMVEVQRYEKAKRPSDKSPL